MANLKFKQTVNERKSNIKTLDTNIYDLVESTDINLLKTRFDEYLIQLDNLTNKHKQYHIDLLILNTPDKIIKTSLRVIIKECVTSISYIERNVVASKIGKKLLPKKIKCDSLINKASVCLTLGLNIINFLLTTNIITTKAITNKESKKIITLVPNDNLIPDNIRTIYSRVRASSYMVDTPVDHTSKSNGGYLLYPKTILNRSGFNKLKYQPNTANIAINKLQKVKYSIRSNYSTELVNEYASTNKWFNSSGQFMTTEWDKFRNDLEVAIKVKDIYFPMAYDNRGRIYETSNYIKLQGDKYQKSMVEFSNKEICTEEGLNYLKIALCNEIHSDKITFEEALDYINSKSIDELQQIITNLGTTNPIATTLFKDYLDALDGKPIGTITHFDCVNSGLQMYSLIGKDKQTAKLCNIVDVNKIADAYRSLADGLNKATNSTKFNRSNVKKAFMTFLYGAMSDQILVKLKDESNGLSNGIKHLFPNDWSNERCWEVFSSIMNDIAPSAIQLMNLIYSYNTKDKTKFRWTMPDGFNVEITSTKTYDGKDSIKGYYLGLDNKTHEGTTSVTLEEYSKYSRSLSPNLIHSLDSYFLREIVRRSNFDISCIHDSFGVHPNNVSKLLTIAREVAADICSSNILIDILNQLDPSQTKYNINNNRIFSGDMTSTDILNSKYILR